MLPSLLIANIQAHRHCFSSDPCYNPFIESQAIDRAHRIGQQRPVFVHKLCTLDTVENEILALQAEKMVVIGNALDETASRGIGRLSTKDLSRLFVSPPTVNILFQFRFESF